MIDQTRAIERIEDLPFTVAEDNWYILLVYKGVRRGAFAQLYSAPWREGDTPLTVSRDLINRVTGTLTSLGLYFALNTVVNDWGLEQPTHGRTRLSETCDIFIANTQEDADALRQARLNHNDSLFGTLLGYPATVLAAYLTDNAVLSRDLAPEYRDSEAGRLAYIALSRNHYKDELQEIQRWVDTLKSTSEVIWMRVKPGYMS